MSEPKVVESWDELLNVNDTEYANVEIAPGVVVRLGSLSAQGMLDWIEQTAGDEEKAKANGLLLVAMCLVDSDGNRIGKLDTMTDLRRKQPKTAKKLIDKALELNDLRASEKEKNDSSGATSPVPPTDSPETSAS